MDKDNLLILNELNKGCNMGSDALEVIIEKIENEKLRDIIFDLLSDYNKLSTQITKLYDKYSDDNAKDTSKMSKVMTWYGIQIRTITDSSDSKLSELSLQGLNMGIIEGRKLLDVVGIDKRVLKILNEYIDIQEQYVEKIKNYL